jgi:hypothetical protein
MWTKKALASVLLTAGVLGAAAVPLPAAADATPRWVHHDGRSTHYAPRWDRDGDGIPNRYDRTPNGRRFVDSDRDGIPNRYDRTPYGRRFADSDRDGIRNRFDRTPHGGRFADRDRDGVPNRFDARPNNSYRY